MVRLYNPSDGGGSGPGGGETLSDVSAESLTAPHSTYTMTSGVPVLFVNNALGTTQSSNNGINLINNTLAAVGAQQISPPFRQVGQGWKTNATAGTQTVEHRQYLLPVQGGATPNLTYLMQYQINGAGWNNWMSFSTAGSSGTVTIPGNLAVTQTSTFSGNVFFQTSAQFATGVPLVTGGTPGTAGYILASGGGGAAPVWTAPTALGINLQSVTTAGNTTNQAILAKNFVLYNLSDNVSSTNYGIAFGEADGGTVQAYQSSMAGGFANGGGLVQTNSLASMALGWVSKGSVVVKETSEGSFALGYIGTDASSTIEVQAGAKGSFAFGRINEMTDGSHIYAGGQGGNLAFGYVQQATSSIQSIGGGSLAFGNTASPDTSITANGLSSFAFGLVEGGSGTYIASSSSASLAGGYASGGYIETGGQGGIAFGDVTSDNSGIFTGSDGAFAFGYTERGYIEATNTGAFAVGRMSGGRLRAAGEGCFAFTSSDCDDTSYVLTDGEASSAFIKLDGDGAIAHSGGNGSYIAGRVESATMEATGNGAIATGNVENGGVISSASIATNASGYVNGSGSMLIADGEGSMAHGHVTDEGQLSASSNGSVAYGVVLHAGSTILSDGYGSFATGYASDAYGIHAGGSGSFAGGRTIIGNILATGVGSFVWSTSGDLSDGGFKATMFGYGYAASEDGIYLGQNAIQVKATTTALYLQSGTLGRTIFGGSLETPYVAKTSTYTAAASDYTIDCTSGTFTVNLPTAVGITGRIYVIKNSGAGVITIDGNGTETIDGSTTKTLNTQYSGYTIQSNGANWIIIASF